MIRTIVTPQNNNLNIAIPNEFIGKEIEILFFPKVEIKEPKPVLNQMTQLEFEQWIKAAESAPIMSIEALEKRWKAKKQEIANLLN